MKGNFLSEEFAEYPFDVTALLRPLLSCARVFLFYYYYLLFFFILLSYASSPRCFFLLDLKTGIRRRRRQRAYILFCLRQIDSSLCIGITIATATTATTLQRAYSLLFIPLYTSATVYIQYNLNPETFIFTFAGAVVDDESLYRRYHARIPQV